MATLNTLIETKKPHFAEKRTEVASPNRWQRVGQFVQRLTGVNETMSTHAPSASRVCALSHATPGCAFQIVRVDVAGKQGKRLAEMGLFEGSHIEIASGCNGGPVVVRFGSSRLAIAQSMAEEIQVTFVGHQA